MMNTFPRYCLLVVSLFITAVQAADDYVGAKQCASCHENEYKLWQGSHHDWAMKPATQESVLGDFNEVEFEHYGEKTRFTKNSDGFFVTTDNDQGQQQTFKVAYTFGFYPLQQYLLPMEGGRLQALSVSWDSRPASEGGQRWFHLYPDEAIPAGDTLHWTGPYQNWNNRCADCHSTNLQRGYDADNDRYDTQWSEINVACESCHGAGKGHLDWLNKKAGSDQPSHSSKHSGFTRDLSAVGTWLRTVDEPTASRALTEGAEATSVHAQEDVCGSCHSRRALLDSPVKSGAYHQKHALSLLQEPTYHPDGQILDEVYVLGSFLQSKMHQKGVVCSNCHEPHSLKLRAEGNGVCAQCHNPQVFDQPEHHHHSAGSTGAQCVNCHMPETTYMVVDPRRDHSLRIPRPDLSEQYGTPNACNQCHQEKTAGWAKDAVSSWLESSGKTLSSHFSDELLKGLTGGQGATQALLSLAMNAQAPDITQASALSGLGSVTDQSSLLVAQTQLGHQSPMVRAAAVRLLGALPEAQRIQELSGYMSDTSKQVRMAVAGQLAGADVSALPVAFQESWRALIKEYEESLVREQDSPDGKASLGLFYAMQGRVDLAENYYLKAIKSAPELMVATLNLADLYRELKRESDAQVVLEKGVAISPTAAPIHHALGLSLIRQKHYAQAETPLAEAAKLSANNLRYGYIYGVLLKNLGKTEKAEQEWLRVLTLDESNRELLLALLGNARDTQRWPQALNYAERLKVLVPDDKGLNQLIAYLRQRVQSSRP